MSDYDDGKDAIFRRMEAVERKRLLADLRAQVVERRAAMDTALEAADGYVQIGAAAGAMAALDEVLELIDGGSDDA